jgi:hypothetical protein
MAMSRFGFSLEAVWATAGKLFTTKNRIHGKLLPQPFSGHPQECKKHRQSRRALCVRPVTEGYVRHQSDDQQASESSGTH